MKDDILLEVKDLKKHFYLSNKERVHAVDGISFFVLKKEILALVGESGCGKTTTGRLILRLIEPDEGEIVFENENYLKYSFNQMSKLRKRMQIIFQDPFSSLDPRKNVESLISEPLIINKYGTKKEIKERITFLMDKVGLTKEMSTKYIHELDGGRCQRIGIARALALDPVLIVCDEPVSALDVSIQAQILNLLEDLSKELRLTYIFISHDLSVVRRISQRIMVMYLGLIVESATTEKLFDNPLHPYSKALISAVPRSYNSKKINRIILKGDVPTPINVGIGCRFFPRCYKSLPICPKVDPVLKKIEPGHYIACHLYD